MSNTSSISVSVSDWKSSFLQGIETAPDTKTKGDIFVQRILIGLGYSSDDAIDATSFGGAGDCGVDALIITESEPEKEDARAEALVIQGKYNTAAASLSPYQESRKFVKAIERAMDGYTVTDAIDRCASVLRSGGLVRYLVATVDPLSASQMSEIEDIRVLARNQFGEGVLIELVSLDDIHDSVAGPNAAARIIVPLRALIIQPTDETYIGVARLTSVYEMMRKYADENHNNVDGIYDRNVRKWLRRRAGSVNSGIYQTLEKQPARFVAFNNGVTLICEAVEHTDSHEEGLLRLVNPYIVNGCQTTRTLYDFIENKFAGKHNALATDNEAEPYREAFLPIKIIAHADDGYRKDITRFSNKQNALRGKDFFSLEDTFRKLQREMRQHGYFLQVQAGEYDALPKHEQQKFPRSNHVIDAFDALRYFASAILKKPQTAFGRSGEFTPGGDEFERAMQGITVDDLLVPWLMVLQASELGYSTGAKRDAQIDDHRNQTRYFFLYILFRIAPRIIFETDDMEDRFTLYSALQRLRDDYSRTAESMKRQHPFSELLSKADQCVKTYMVLARQQNWYSDRNAFLKSIALLSEEHYTMATAGPLTDTADISTGCKAILASSI